MRGGDAIRRDIYPATQPRVDAAGGSNKERKINYWGDLMRGGGAIRHDTRPATQLRVNAAV